MENRSDNEYINLSRWINLYVKKWYIFAIAIACCLVVGVVYFKLAKPTYLITANILIQEEDKQSVNGMQAMLMNSFSFSSMLGGSQSIYDELEIISSFSTFKEVVKKLNLHTMYKEKGFFTSDQYYANAPVMIKSKQPIEDTLGTPLKFKIKIDKQKRVTAGLYMGFRKKAEIKSVQVPATFRTKFGDFTIDVTPFYTAAEEAEVEVLYTGYDFAAELLQEKVAIDLASKKANIINLQINEKNRQKGKDILNALIRIYNLNGIERKNILAASTRQFLDSRLDLISAELDDIEKNIEVYKKANSITDIEAEAKIILEKSSDFKEKLIEAEAQYTVIELVEEFLEMPENKYSLVPLNIGLSDRTVLEGLQKYNDALLERMKLLKTTQDNNPVAEILNEQINAMRSNMLATIRSLKSGFSHSRENLRTQEDYFISRIKGMPTQEREFVNIKRQQMIKQELYVFLLQKQEENSLTMAISTPKALVVDDAYSLRKPVKPKLKIVLFLMLVLGGCIAVGIISLKPFFSKRK